MTQQPKPLWLKLLIVLGAIIVIFIILRQINCALFNRHSCIPVGPFFVVDDDAFYTRSTDVTISFDIEGDSSIRLTESSYSPNSGFPTPYWQPFKPLITMTLAADPGRKDILAYFFSSIWYPISENSDSIILDYTAPLNMVKATQPNDLSPPLRQLTFEAEDKSLPLNVVFNDGYNPIYLPNLKQKTISLPNVNGCLFVYQDAHKPHIQLIPTGNLTIPITSTTLISQTVGFDNKQGRFFVSGCYPQSITQPLSVKFINFRESEAQQKPLTSQKPFFTFVALDEWITVELLDNQQNILAREMAIIDSYTVHYSAKIVIVDLKIGHFDEWGQIGP